MKVPAISFDGTSDGVSACVTGQQFTFRPHYVCAGELNLHGGYAAAKEVLKNEEITAIFVAMMKWRWSLKPLKKRAKNS